MELTLFLLSFLLSLLPSLLHCSSFLSFLLLPSFHPLFPPTFIKPKEKYQDQWPLESRHRSLHGPLWVLISVYPPTLGSLRSVKVNRHFFPEETLLKALNSNIQFPLGYCIYINYVFFIFQVQFFSFPTSSNCVISLSSYILRWFSRNTNWHFWCMIF